jgi:hypothetical protein
MSVQGLTDTPTVASALDPDLRAVRNRVPAWRDSRASNSTPPALEGYEISISYTITLVHRIALLEIALVLTSCWVPRVSDQIHTKSLSCYLLTSQSILLRIYRHNLSPLH